MCVHAPVHKIKVHTNLLTLQTVCIRRIEVEVSFHTFKKKKKTTFPIMSFARHSSNRQPYQESKFPGEPGPPCPSSLDPGGRPAFQPLPRPAYLSLRRLGL